MYEFGKKLGEGAYGYVITARAESNPKVTYACKVSEFDCCLFVFC
jgi:hypothetical protein